jgi:hypothetical protein
MTCVTGWLEVSIAQSRMELDVYLKATRCTQSRQLRKEPFVLSHNVSIAWPPLEDLSCATAIHGMQATLQGYNHRHIDRAQLYHSRELKTMFPHLPPSNSTLPTEPTSALPSTIHSTLSSSSTIPASHPPSIANPFLSSDFAVSTSS